MAVDETPSVMERYAAATQTADLTLRKGRCDADMLLAAGYAAHHDETGMAVEQRDRVLRREGGVGFVNHEQAREDGEDVGEVGVGECHAGGCVGRGEEKGPRGRSGDAVER